MSIEKKIGRSWKCANCHSWNPDAHKKCNHCGDKR